MDFSHIDIVYLLPFIAVGFAAQLVDGALGMAFGVITNTLLVGVLGVPPATASQRVHIVDAADAAADRERDEHRLGAARDDLTGGFASPG